MRYIVQICGHGTAFVNVKLEDPTVHSTRKQCVCEPVARICPTRTGNAVERRILHGQTHSYTGWGQRKKERKSCLE
jgi:hypothetical protein